MEDVLESSYTSQSLAAASGGSRTFPKRFLSLEKGLLLCQRLSSSEAHMETTVVEMLLAATRELVAQFSPSCIFHITLYKVGVKE